MTSVRQDRFIRLTHLLNRFQSADATSRQTRGLNNRPIAVTLYVVGLRARRPYCAPRLTRRHRAERLRWCRNSVNRRLRVWHDMLFSDQSRFCGETYPQPTKTAYERQLLLAALRQEWNNMPQAFIIKLVNSIKRRCTAVVNADEDHTR